MNFPSGCQDLTHFICGFWSRCLATTDIIIWQCLRINLVRRAAVLGSEIPFAEACHDGRLLKGDQPQKAIMASFTAGKNHVASQTSWRHFLHQSRWVRREQGRTCILPAISWCAHPLENIGNIFRAHKGSTRRSLTVLSEGE